MPDYPYRASDPLMLPDEFGRLRADQPVVAVKVASGDTVWLVTRYDDAKLVLADPRLSRNIGRPEAARLIPGVRMPSMPLADPPAHTRWRKLLAKAFTARQISEMRPAVTRLVDQLLDGIESGPVPVDLMEHFAFPLPIGVVCVMLGLDAGQQEPFRKQAALALSTEGASAQERGAAFGELAQQAAGIIADRRSDLGDDLLSTLIAARDTDEGQLTEEELVATVMTLLIGGYENPAHQLGKGLYTLFRHPDQLAALRADPSVLPAAVEEMLRYTGALDSGFGSPRFALADIEIGGVTIPQGATVLVIRQSANRDETRFDDPDRFDISREPTQHLVFGFGPHHCIGAALARLEIEVGMGRLLARFPQLRLAVPIEDIQWAYRVTASGPAALPARW
jgi:cytochrome P450